MNPAKTTSLEEFITAGADVDVTYYLGSILEPLSNGVYINFHNIFFDYLDILKKSSRYILLTNAELNTYMYAPDLLAYKLYGYTELGFILMMLNNINDIKDFTKQKLLVLNPDSSDLLGSIIDAESENISLNREYISE